MSEEEKSGNGNEGVGNVLVREEQKPKEETPATLYDANAENRFEFEVNDGSEIYDTAHVYQPCSDERFLQFVEDINARSAKGGEEVEVDDLEAGEKCWDDVIARVENIEVPEGVDFRTLISASEKNESLHQFLAVAVVTADKKSVGVRKLGDATTGEQCIVTEAWFNGQPLQQKHFLVKKTFELQKQFDRLQRKQTKQEKITGLYKRKPDYKFVPQTAKLGELYQKMVIRTEGFVGDVVPVRFQEKVINYIFAPKLDPKLVGK